MKLLVYRLGLNHSTPEKTKILIEAKQAELIATYPWLDKKIMVIPDFKNTGDNVEMLDFTPFYPNIDPNLYGNSNFYTKLGLPMESAAGNGPINIDCDEKTPMAGTTTSTVVPFPERPI